MHAGAIERGGLDQEVFGTRLQRHAGIKLIAHQRLAAANVVIDHIVDHGMSLSVYSLDPDGIMMKQLKVLWQGFAGALAARDKAKVMQYLNAQARDESGPVFDPLLSGMPQILASFSNLQIVTINNDIAGYAINRIVDRVNRIFFIYLLRDADGVWRVDSM